MSADITLPAGAPEEVVTNALVRDIDLAAFGGKGSMALITLDNGHDHNRPNTFGPQSVKALDAAITDAIARKPAAIAITGKPFIFAAGADLSALSFLSERSQSLAIGKLGHDVFRRLDEIGPCHHADQRRPRHIAQCAQFSGGQNGLHMRLATGRAHFCHFIIKRLPVLRQHMAARDHDVDLFRPRLHALADFRKAQVVRRQARRKPGRHCGNGDIRPFQRANGGFHHLVIDADRAHCQAGQATIDEKERNASRALAGVGDRRDHEKI